MKTSKEWFTYFNKNLQVKRINWQQTPEITVVDLQNILPSLQAWQLGETSDGKNLIRVSSLYATKINDLSYVSAVDLFIKEEQKHGNNLGKYLDLIGQSRIKQNWGDTLFRQIRYFNTSMELWTLAVITVESSAQIFYQSLKDATTCNLLKEICTDILIDEAAHIEFQKERMEIIFKAKNIYSRLIAFYCYKFFFFSTTLVVWFAHKKVFKAGNNDFKSYYRKMSVKYEKTLGRLKHATSNNYKPAFA